MSKVKKVPRKKLAYTKRRQQSRRTMKPRKLRGKTRNRKYKMRGGLNIKLVNLLAALFAVAKVENPNMYKGKIIGPKEQLEYAIENKNHLLVVMKDPDSPMYENGFVDFNVTKNLDLSSIIGDMNGKSSKELSTGEINVDDYKLDMSTGEINVDDYKVDMSTDEF